MDDIFDIFQYSDELAPIREVTNLGLSDLTFQGLLPGGGLKVHEDGGASGCGGKLWPAGELLSKYLLENGLNGKKKIVELGSGTGLVGLAVALKETEVNQNKDLEIWVTDQECLIPLILKNTELNNLSEYVHPIVLNWGEELPEIVKSANIDLVLAADCVYLETAFPLLKRTLLDLAGDGVQILMSYKKRRKADSKFFSAVRKDFEIIEVKNFADYESYLRDGVHLYSLEKR
ncbi:hypothetical protein NADFUDRAFT_40450 [Nadsonia fulvescens var. elongata DSM 6958]|uniref:Protein-lysine N-methyltransferase EFM6 n=1 Tax=Nadsonia fulvescens var. elongata DSM 6958 TaxID=857566 RepID=A0A1E3PPC4_9ASCO|nr:hypothetical protein NADFUDRAFT_40450 [Nadsonia fulvescens var. elongata DSM 6958]